MPMQVHRNAAVKTRTNARYGKNGAVRTIKLNSAIAAILNKLPDNRGRILDENTIVVWNSPEHAELMRKVVVS